MRKPILAILLLTLLQALPAAASEHDDRQLVKLPPMMQQHMLHNMRDHLQALHEILTDLALGRTDDAADVAEQRLGMSSLEAHGAAHMAPFMPQAMRDAGTLMHHAASRFALVAQEGDTLKAYAALQEVTAGCVACHANFRIR